MIILHVGKYFYPDRGGIETVTFDVAVEQARLGHKVTVLCVSEKKRFGFWREVIEGVEVIRTGFLLRVAGVSISPAYIASFYRMCRRFDVLHFHYPNPLACLLLCFSKSRRGLVIHWHSDIVRQKFFFRFFRIFQQWSLNKADLVIATSHNYANGSVHLKDFLHKTDVIPIGIPDPVSLRRGFFRFDLPKQHYRRRIMVFSLGRHVYYKGFPVLLRAIALLPDHYSLVLGGEGPLTPQLVRLVKELGLEHRVEFPGAIDNTLKNRFLGNCSVFCLPSVERSEAFGIVQIEAMSFGVPVVSCDIPSSGVSEINQDGLSGVIAKPGDPEDLARAITQAAGFSPDQRSAIRDYFMENFQSSIQAENIINAYERCLL